MSVFPENKLYQYQTVKSRQELAEILLISHRFLTYLLYGKKDEEKYYSFTIPKKGGGEREIFAPINELKSLQRRLANDLLACIDATASKTGKRNFASHGFVPGKSIVTNAIVHKNKRYVFNLDIQDFFPTISAKRIRGFFIKDRRFLFSPQVATTLAHIACRNGVLPQGSPCSPVISNLILGILDVHLSRLARKCGCHYTRYADDITFSTNLKKFPSEIACKDPVDPHKWNVGHDLKKIITTAGFSINETKTRMQYKTTRQVVTGLVVNKRVNVPLEYRRRVRAYVFALINKGEYEIRSKFRNADGTYTQENKLGTKAQLHGMLGFIHSIDNMFLREQKNNPYNYFEKQAEKTKITGNLAVYRRFLLYINFYANDLPFIVCEGKTDNVYISNAVHQLQNKFPNLVTYSVEREKKVLSFKFLKYARQNRKTNRIYTPSLSTASILGAGSGGGPNMAKILNAYSIEYEKFGGRSKGLKPKYPVLFIIDNDDGGKSVLKVAKNKNKKLRDKEIKDLRPFARVFGNVYIIPILKGDLDKKTEIEDLFAPADYAQFQKLSKEDFAYQYVVNKASELNWSGFETLLQSISEVFLDYQRVLDEGRI